MIGAGVNALALNAPVDDEFVDWAAGVNFLTTRTYYAMDIDDRTLPPIRVPISSWQATMQVGRSSFAQAVVPAASVWESEIYARADEGEFIIRRGAEFEDGSVQESELARAPLQTIRRQQGPTNTTITLSGYAFIAAATINTRELQNIRSITNDPGIRVRCDIDWFLRPGQIAVANGQAFTVAYINYYANVGDQFMDVGERVT